MRLLTASLLLLGLPQGPLKAQSPTVLLAAGDSLTAALRPDLALERYEAALGEAPVAYEALSKAGRAAADVAQQIEANDARSRTLRDSLYQLARAYAERAIRADSTDADGHFVLALALGRVSRTRGGRERVRFGRIIYDASARALALRPDHDGAHHVLGAWHAEVKRLPGVTRFWARVLFGAGFLGRAGWDSATTHLERAVELDPQHVYHRLELAEIYVDLQRYADATAQLEAIATLPDGDVMDPRYRRKAAELLDEIKGRAR